MNVKELVNFLTSDGVDPNSEVFWSGLDQSFNDRSLQKVGKTEELGNHVVLTPGNK